MIKEGSMHQNYKPHAPAAGVLVLGRGLNKVKKFKNALFL